MVSSYWACSHLIVPPKISNHIFQRRLFRCNSGQRTERFVAKSFALGDHGALSKSSGVFRERFAQP